MDAKIYNFMGNAFFSSPAVLGAFLRQPVILCPRNSVSPPPFFSEPSAQESKLCRHSLFVSTSSYDLLFSKVHILPLRCFIRTYSFCFRIIRIISLMYLHLYRRFICLIKRTAHFLPPEYSRAAPVTLSPISLRTRLESKRKSSSCFRLSS